MSWWRLATNVLILLCICIVGALIGAAIMYALLYWMGWL